MNIFILDNNMQTCAEFHNDRHIVKMVTETAQLLSYVYHQNSQYAPNFLYKVRKAHLKHPCTIWSGESINNFLWLCDFGIALFNEYQYRYNKPFKHWKGKFIFEWCKNNPPVLPNIERTPFKLAIKKEKYPQLLEFSKNHNIIETYREYYKLDKQFYFVKGKKVNHTWTKRQKPQFLKEDL